jgi:hypothetical protein
MEEYWKQNDIHSASARYKNVGGESKFVMFGCESPNELRAKNELGVGSAVTPPIAVGRFYFFQGV